jgi:hypothetical protein
MSLLHVGRTSFGSAAWKMMQAYHGATVQQANSGKRAHVGARADIAAVMREIKDLVEQLNVMKLTRTAGCPGVAPSPARQ